MLNNDVRLIGVALSNYEIEGKTAKFRIELTKQKSGETYELEIRAFTNSKAIRFEEKIKGKIVAVAGFIDDKYQINASNVLSLSGSREYNPTSAAAKDIEVVTAKDLENDNNIIIGEDELPF